MTPEQPVSTKWTIKDPICHLGAFLSVWSSYSSLNCKRVNRPERPAGLLVFVAIQPLWPLKDAPFWSFYCFRFTWLLDPGVLGGLTFHVCFVLRVYQISVGQWINCILLPGTYGWLLGVGQESWGAGLNVLPYVYIFAPQQPRASYVFPKLRCRTFSLPPASA